MLSAPKHDPAKPTKPEHTARAPKARQSAQLPENMSPQTLAQLLQQMRF